MPSEPIGTWDKNEKLYVPGHEKLIVYRIVFFTSAASPKRWYEPPLLCNVFNILIHFAPPFPLDHQQLRFVAAFSFLQSRLQIVVFQQRL